MNQASVGHHCPECVAGGGQQVVTARQITEYRPPLTVAIMAANALAYVAQTVVGRQLTNDGLLFGPLVGAGEVWRIITSGFLHGSLMHIGFNMYALWLFGRSLERGVGSVRYGLIYLAGLLGGAAAVLAFNYDAPTLGASGAVLGLAGGIAGVSMARGRSLQETGLLGIFAFNLALPLLVPRISFWGHFGGIAAGFIAAWILTWLPERRRVQSSVTFGLTVAFCAVLAVVCVVLGYRGV